MPFEPNDDDLRYMQEVHNSLENEERFCLELLHLAVGRQELIAAIASQKMEDTHLNLASYIRRHPRCWMVKQLCIIRSVQDIPLLRELITDPDPDVRKEAILGLGKYLNSDALKHLAETVMNGKFASQDRKYARTGLINLLKEYGADSGISFRLEDFLQLTRLIEKEENKELSDQTLIWLTAKVLSQRGISDPEISGLDEPEIKSMVRKTLPLLPPPVQTRIQALLKALNP